MGGEEKRWGIADGELRMVSQTLGLGLWAMIQNWR